MSPLFRSHLAELNDTPLVFLSFSFFQEIPVFLSNSHSTLHYIFCSRRHYTIQNDAIFFASEAQCKSKSLNSPENLSNTHRFPTIIIPMGSETRKWNPGLQRVKTRVPRSTFNPQRVPLRQQKRVYTGSILWSSSFASRKRIEVLVRAVALLPATTENALDV